MRRRFLALEEAIASGTTAFRAAEVAVDRLHRALDDPAATPADLAVLVRQVLRAETVRRGGGSRPRLPVPAGVARDAASLERFGLRIDHGTGRIEANPWMPNWSDVAVRSPAGASFEDVAASARASQVRVRRCRPPADPFLARLVLSTYRSTGQRAAIRSALLTPPGATLAVDLPTGEGKSLVFRVFDRIGFASDPSPVAGTPPTGVTVVIVPTVALAYDHENSNREPGQDELLPTPVLATRRARSAGRASVSGSYRQPVAGSCSRRREAACGSLRGPLRQAATEGRLRALVIDEAHLVDGWGTGFRTEFQLLSGLRAELVASRRPTNARGRSCCPLR